MTKPLGFSLLEFILSLALSAILILVATETYFSIQQTHQLQTALAGIQETGRFVISTLDHRIRMAGADDCEKKKNWVNTEDAIQGYSSDDLPTWLQGQVKAETDVIVVGECIQYQGIPQFTKTAYFIADTGRVNAQGESIDALYTKPMGGPRQELASDIENMKIRYGVTSVDGKDVLAEKPAASISDWTKVRSVSIALLLNSEKAVLKTASPYVFNGETFTEHGKWLHKEWDTYIFLRDLYTLDHPASS